jgi:hypothetical protein
MSREYETSLWQKMYGRIMHADNYATIPADVAADVPIGEAHRRPPADRLFCRGDGLHAARQDMAAGEKAHFAEHFARDFAAALSEARRERLPA